MYLFLTAQSLLSPYHSSPRHLLRFQPRQSSAMQDVLKRRQRNNNKKETVSQQTVVEMGGGGSRGGGGGVRADMPTNSAVGPNHGREECECMQQSYKAIGPGVNCSPQRHCHKCGKKKMKRTRRNKTGAHSRLNSTQHNTIVNRYGGGRQRWMGKL